MPYDALSFYQALDHGQQESEQTLGGLLQNSYNNISGAISEAARVNQGVMQSAINAKQLAIDSWYKQQELQRQNIQLGLSAQELQLHNRQLDIMQQYHQDSIDKGYAAINERAAASAQSQANRTATTTLNAQILPLKLASSNLKATIKQDLDLYNTVNKTNTGNPADILLPGQSDIANQKAQLPIIQQRIQSNQARLDKITNVLQSSDGMIGLMQAGADPSALVKQFSSSFSLQDLNPSTYAPVVGQPITNADALAPIPALSANQNPSVDPNDDSSTDDPYANVTYQQPLPITDNTISQQPSQPTLDQSSMADDSSDTQTYSDVPESQLGQQAPIKFGFNQGSMKIQDYLRASKQVKLTQEDPYISNFVNNYVDQDGQNQYKNIQNNFLKQVAQDAYDTGLNPSRDSQNLNRTTPSGMHNYYAAGGTEDQLSKVKQDFNKFGQMTQDGSLPSSLTPNSLSGVDLNKANNAQKIQLGDNLINSYPAFQTGQTQPSTTDPQGRAIGGLDSTGEMKLDSGGNVLVPRDNSIPLSNDELDAQQSEQDNQKEIAVRASVNNIMSKGDKTILAALSGLPSNAILSLKEQEDAVHAPGALSNDNDQYPIIDPRDLYNAKVKKIQKLFKTKDYSTIYNLLSHAQSGDTMGHTNNLDSDFNFPLSQNDISDAHALISSQ